MGLRVGRARPAGGFGLGCRSAVAGAPRPGLRRRQCAGAQGGGNALGARAWGSRRPNSARAPSASPPARPAPQPPPHGAEMAGAPRGRGGGGGGGGGGAGEPGGAERAAGPGGRRGLRACDEEFACPELEALFRGYTLRLEQAATLKALAVLSLLAGALALAELLGAPGPAAGLAKGSHPVHCVLFLALLVVTNVRSLQVPQLQQVGQLALLFSFTFALLCCPFALGGPAGIHVWAAAGPVTADQGVWQLLLVTFVSYALLPVRSLLAIGFGFVVAVSHLLVTATLVPAKRSRLWRTVSAVARLPPGPGHTAREVWEGWEPGAYLRCGQLGKLRPGMAGAFKVTQRVGDIVTAGTLGPDSVTSYSPQSAPGCGVWRRETGVEEGRIRPRSGSR